MFDPGIDSTLRYWDLWAALTDRGKRLPVFNSFTDDAFHILEFFTGKVDPSARFSKSFFVLLLRLFRFVEALFEFASPRPMGFRTSVAESFFVSEFARNRLSLFTWRFTNPVVRAAFMNTDAIPDDSFTVGIRFLKTRLKGNVRFDFAADGAFRLVDLSGDFRHRKPLVQTVLNQFSSDSVEMFLIRHKALLSVLEGEHRRLAESVSTFFAKQERP